MKRNDEKLIWIEAENFEDLGGWVIDQQFMDYMGSPFLLAHGMGIPVADAKTRIVFPGTGMFHVWVRTRDWAAPWKEELKNETGKYDRPGKFKLLVNGKELDTLFGTGRAEWHWQFGGEVEITQNENELRLHDLTGFEGRCDAIVFSNDPELILPDNGQELESFRRKSLGYPEKPEKAGNFNFVVVGGGIAGICASVAAARKGLKVALIQDRPLVGGNNSSEIRVQLGGKVNLPPYPAIGNLVNELNPEFSQNARPAKRYKDWLKMDIVKNETNLSLFLNTHVNGIEMDGQQIQSVIAQDVITGKRLEFFAPVFADCSGDGTLGYLAGADYRYGREARSETGETLAPKLTDNLTMGTSVMWYSVKRKGNFPFPETPWALQFNETSCQKVIRGDWNWELGLGRNQLAESEFIRDYGFRVIYGNWSYLKNKSTFNEEYKSRRLEWVSYVGGKRESRRLMGDVLLKQQDIENSTPFPDACVTTTWTIDLHYPKDIPGIQEETFRTNARKKKIQPYSIPFRCLYSRNIDNLMMAGRNISVTHVALGTVRVMKTTGMMGEVIGIAASLCKKGQIKPREIYTNYLNNFIELLKEGIPQKNK
ncbi:MAG: FAD-dependent oxidoreductase [Mangrovibacterium sp.]